MYKASQETAGQQANPGAGASSSSTSSSYSTGSNDAEVTDVDFEEVK